MTEYDDAMPIPVQSKPGSRPEAVGVCVGGPIHGAMLTVYPASVYPGQIIVSKYSDGEYTYQPETEEYAAAFMWRDY